jgi:pimeloyl-ACP methyl ester carboxylesterase
MKNNKRFTLQKLISLICIIIMMSHPGFTQELPRRVFVGIRMEKLTDDMKRIIGLPDVKGIMVNEVLPRSTAEKAGFKKGDVLTTINGKSVNSPDEVLSALSGFKNGDKFQYEIIREKKKIKGASAFMSFPSEKYAGLETIYSESKTSIGLQRIIITKQKSEKRQPVIAFIGGIGCYSLDFPMDSNRSEVQLLNKLSRAGFICARLEKPGMGDNAKHCKPCAEVSFTEETNGYVQAIRTLKMRPDVDSNSIYILGHSMGGVFAPLIAQQTSVKGIIAYGTIGSNFIEYIAKTRRTIAEAYKMSPEETDDLIKDFCECSSYYFVEKMSTEEAARKNPDCKEFLSIFDLRSRAYNDELYSYNIPGLWKPFTGKALLLWGESDFVASREDHAIVANSVNYYHKGNAEFLTVPNTDHGMNLAKGFSEAQRSPGPYNPEVGNVISNWLLKQ